MRLHASGVKKCTSSSQPRDRDPTIRSCPPTGKLLFDPEHSYGLPQSQEVEVELYQVAASHGYPQGRTNSNNGPGAAQEPLEYFAGRCSTMPGPPSTRSGFSARKGPAQAFEQNTEISPVGSKTANRDSPPFGLGCKLPNGSLISGRSHYSDLTFSLRNGSRSSQNSDRPSTTRPATANSSTVPKHNNSYPPPDPLHRAGPFLLTHCMDNEYPYPDPPPRVFDRCASPTDSPPASPRHSACLPKSFVNERGWRYKIRRGRQAVRQPSFIERLELLLCSLAIFGVVAALGYLLFLGRAHKKFAHAAFVGGTLALMVLTGLVATLLRRPYGEVVITMILVVCVGFFAIQQLDDWMVYH